MSSNSKLLGSKSGLIFLDSNCYQADDIDRVISVRCVTENQPDESNISFSQGKNAYVI